MTESSEGELFSWKKIGVKRERNHETLISRLNKDNRDIFVFLKDTMIFSAMIGYHYAEKRPLKGGTIEILLETYATDEKDSFIYLLSLLEERDALILKDDRLKGSVSVFEEYCNAGLYQIESWLDENPGDPSGVDTLLDKIYERLCDDQDKTIVDNSLVEEPNI